MEILKTDTIINIEAFPVGKPVKYKYRTNTMWRDALILDATPFYITVVTIDERLGKVKTDRLMLDEFKQGFVTIKNV